MAGSIIAAVLIIFLIVYCAARIHRETAAGELCECSGDCTSCKIQCRSNPNYYGGKSPSSDVENTDSLSGKFKKRYETFKRENIKYYPRNPFLTFLQNFGMMMMLAATFMMLLQLILAVFQLIFIPWFMLTIVFGMGGNELKQLAERKFEKKKSKIRNA